MKPEDDPWLKDAHANAERLDREIKKLSSLTAPIRSNLPIVTKYQDFWSLAKSVSTLFREMKPLAKNDRELLWKQFNALCWEVKEHQKVSTGRSNPCPGDMRTRSGDRLIWPVFPLAPSPGMFRHSWSMGLHLKMPPICWRNSNTR